MPGTTTRGFRYPLDTDPVNDGALAVRNLASDVNTKVGAVAGGIAGGIVLTSTAAAVRAIAFPAGRFSASADLIVVATIRNVPNPEYRIGVRVQSITAAGADIVVFSTTGAAISTTCDVSWMAVQQ